MKHGLLKNVALTAILALSVSACQDKKNDDSAPAAAPATAAPQEPVTVDTVAVKKSAHEEATLKLESIGVRFVGNGTEGIVVADPMFDENHKRKVFPKLSLESQIEIMRNFLVASEELLASIESVETENESAEEMNNVFLKSEIECQIAIVSSKLKRAEIKLKKEQKQAKKKEKQQKLQEEREQKQKEQAQEVFEQEGNDPK